MRLLRSKKLSQQSCLNPILDPILIILDVHIFGYISDMASKDERDVIDWWTEGGTYARGHFTPVIEGPRRCDR